MQSLDTNVFTEYFCKFLNAKTIDLVYLVNKQYNQIIKKDIKHLFNLYWEVFSTYGKKKPAKLKCKEFLKDGKREGYRFRWFPNGRIWLKKFYKEGKHEGEQLEWHENGQLYRRDFYKDDNRIGEHLQWRQDGKLEAKEFYKEGELIREIEWDEDGELFYDVHHYPDCDCEMVGGCGCEIEPSFVRSDCNYFDSYR
jgi:antitoxin component YwqK of YwqJK toxin-antitoxin module